MSFHYLTNVSPSAGLAKIAFVPSANNHLCWHLIKEWVDIIFEVLIMVIEFCSYCNQGYLKPTEEVVLEGEVGINLIDIGGKRIFACDSCGQIQVRIRKNEYVKIRRDIKTRHW